MRDRTIIAVTNSVGDIYVQNDSGKFRPIPSATFTAQIGDRVLIITGDTTSAQAGIEGIVTSTPKYMTKVE
jgi:hypothetical protein